MADVPPSADGRAARWHLSDASAAALLAWLAGCPDAGERLTAAARLDPWLARWICDAASADGVGPPRSLAEAVRRFVVRKPESLSWPDDRAARRGDLLSLPDSSQGASLAVDAVFWAELARQAAVASGQVDGEEAYLAALLAETAANGANAGGAADASAEVSYEAEPGAGLAQCLAVARAAAQSGQRGKRISGLDRATARLLARKAREAWKQTPVGPGACLIGLAEKLVRLARLEADFERRLEEEKLAALAEFAAAAGHEINNPLAVISGRAQLFLRDEPDPERRRDLAVVRGQALRIHEMIADLMLFARPPAPEFEQVDLGPVVDCLLRELAPDARQRRVALASAVEPGLVVRADPVQVMVALRALGDNALAAIGHDGRIDVAARRVAYSTPANRQAGHSAPNSEAAGWAEITVADDGPGIPAEVRRHLFDPFYSGRSAGRGLGMGLAKCWRIVQLHGGQIDVESQTRAGAAFTLRLPLVTASTPPPPRSAPVSS
jgi:signal transduction histidine kinase